MSSTQRHALGLIGISVVYCAIHGAIFMLAPTFDPSPHNDDWMYVYAVERLANGDGLQLHPLTLALALPQIFAGWLWSVILGHVSFSSLRFGMVVFGLVPVWTLYAFLCRWQGSVALAAAAALTFAANPLVIALTWSFMTEIPFTALVLATVAAWALLGEPPRPRRLLLLLVLATATSLQRQIGELVCIALACWLLHRRLWGWFIALIVAAIAAPLVQHWAYTTQPLHELIQHQEWLRQGLVPPTLAAATRMAYLCTHGICLLGLLLLPMLLLPVEVQSSVTSRGFANALAILAVGGMVVFDAKSGWSVLFGNYLDPLRGTLGPALLLDVIAGKPRPGLANPAGLYWMINVLGWFGGYRLLVRLFDQLPVQVRNLRVAEWTAAALNYWAFWLMLASSMLINAVIDRAPYDRYLLPVLPFAIGITIPNQSKKKWLLTAVGACCVIGGGYGIVGTVDYWRWNEARWIAARWAEEQGVHYKRVRAGFEYHGLRQTEEYRRHGGGDYDQWQWWFGDGYIVQFRPAESPDERTVHRVEFSTPLSRSPQAVYVVRKASEQP